MTIAYLMNRYPQPSQTFIRRETAALEAQGVPVARFCLRRPEGPLVDDDDRWEQQKTRYVLDVGALGLLWAMLVVAVTRPILWMAALSIAMRVGYRGDRGRRYHLIYLAEACVLLSWLRRAGATHLHAHFGTNAATVAMLCHALGGPRFSFTVHGPEEFDHAGRLALAEKIARADWVAGVSQYGRSQLCRYTPLAAWNKIHVVHCGLDESFFASPPPLPEDTNRLVTVARLHEQKGLPVLVEAAAQLVRAGHQLEIVIVGDGPLRGELEALIARNGLEGVIKLAGWKDGNDVRAIVRSARALVVPSFAEGLPVVIMEALALGRPVVSTNVAGIAELVTPGVCGWLVPAGDAEALAAAMGEALSTPVDELARLGAAGARRVRTQHRAATEAKKLAALMRAIVPACGSLNLPQTVAPSFEIGQPRN